MGDEIQDTGADTQTATAEEQGNLGEKAGADTHTHTAEDGGEQAEEIAEGQEPDKKGAEDKGAHQTTLEERAAQIAEKKVAEALERDKAERERIEKEAKERIEAEKKPFIELSAEQSSRLNEDYIDATARVAELQELLRLGERSSEVITELRQTEKWIRDTENWYAENETKKTEWQKAQQLREEQGKVNTERARQLEETANVYREAHGIPQDVWDESSKWFSEQLGKDKLLLARFQDAFKLHGNVGAVEFAHKYCQENMGKEEQETIKQKEKAKQNLPPGGAPNANTSAPDLKKLLEKAQKTGSEEDYLAYVDAKRAAAS